MRFDRRFLYVFVIAVFLLSACGDTADESGITEEDILLTSSVGTMVSAFFGTQTAIVEMMPTDTNTPLPTNTFLPTPEPYNTQLPVPPTWTPVLIYYTSTPNLALTPTVTGTPPTATANTGALAFGCNNSAFVRDVNYPGGTEVSPGEEFVKTWKVENTGSCNWEYNYGMAVVNDQYFDSSWNRLGRNVLPGDWGEVSVIVTAPNHEGTYSGYWRMADAGGNAFGATLGLTIVVK